MRGVLAVLVILLSAGPLAADTERRMPPDPRPSAPDPGPGPSVTIKDLPAPASPPLRLRPDDPAARRDRARKLQAAVTALEGRLATATRLAAQTGNPAQRRALTELAKTLRTRIGELRREIRRMKAAPSPRAR